ncbi:leucyl/phenylalanyl-tRNA--protein transferase [Bordetella sp. 2513F-2]
MKLPWLTLDTPFPPAHLALEDPPGLLAAGGDLSTARLEQAYRNGIFPWFSEGEPILWWSPDPRMVLACRDFAPSHSLRKRLRQIARQSTGSWPSVRVRVDTAFDEVMQQCAAPREGQAGTWITPAVRKAYHAWHQAGRAHSIETWIDGELAGGLYGVSLGRMFFGESMFARTTDASKIALAYLVRFLSRHDVAWIDCQQQTRHLASLGAGPVPRARFLQHLADTVDAPPPPWMPGEIDAEGRLQPLPPATLL